MMIQEMKQIDIRTVDKSLLVDRNTLNIDKNLPRKERLIQYVKQIKNPYCYLDGDVIVKVSFSDNNVSIEDCLQAYIRSM